MEYNLYILKSIKVYKYYTGVSKNSHRRLEYHNTIERGFTSRYRPWEIVFTKKFKTKAEAMAAEKKVKGWKSKKMIEKLINGEIILWTFGIYLEGFRDVSSPDKGGITRGVSRPKIVWLLFNEPAYVVMGFLLYKVTP